MSRKIKEVVIEAEGRDKGKTFVIEEMAAAHAEKWAMRLLLLAMKAGADVDIGAGMAGIATLALQSLHGGVDFAEAEPLLDEMFACIKHKPSANVARKMIDDDTEEVATRLLLRAEWLTLHLGFSTADAASKLSAKPSAKT